MLILDKPTQITPKLVIGQESDLDPRIFSVGVLVADPQTGVIKIADGENTFSALPSTGGTQGPQGETGATGPQGLQGATGPVGVTGPAGYGLPPIAKVTGRFYDGAAFAAQGTIAGAANRVDLYPTVFPQALTIDQIGVSVSTAVASALAKVVVYSATAAGWPDALLYESADLNCATTGFKQVTASLTFAANTIYWLGVRHSSTATIRGIPIAGLPSLGMATGNDSTYGSIIRRTVTFATAAPNPWVFNAAEITANVVAGSVRMRRV